MTENRAQWLNVSMPEELIQFYAESIARFNCTASIDNPDKLWSVRSNGVLSWLSW